MYIHGGDNSGLTTLILSLWHLALTSTAVCSVQTPSSRLIDVESFGGQLPYTCVSSWCFMILTTSAVYITNRIEPSTDPSGIPYCIRRMAQISRNDDRHVVDVWADRSSTITMLCRQNKSTIRRRCSKLMWSAVSNVTGRSRRAEATMSPASSANQMSAIRLAMAVSVDLKAW